MLGWNEFTEIAAAAGVPATLGLFVLYVLYKNGFLKIIMRDASVDLAISNDRRIDEMSERLHAMETSIAVLKALSDRSMR